MLKDFIEHEIATLITQLNRILDKPITGFFLKDEPILQGFTVILHRKYPFENCFQPPYLYITFHSNHTITTYSIPNSSVDTINDWANSTIEKYRQINRTSLLKHELSTRVFTFETSPDQLLF